IDQDGAQRGLCVRGGGAARMNAGQTLTRSVRGLSIAQQVLLLLLVATVVAQAINIAIVANLPPPPRPIIRLGDVTQKMDAMLPRLNAAEPGKRRAILEHASDRAVRFMILDHAPGVEPDDNAGQLFAARVARKLEMPAADVLVRTRKQSFMRVVL